MNKILNWTLGSVFRTIGRVFGYLLIGGLFALIMSKSGLKITDLLGIDTINASTITIGTPKGWASYYYECDNYKCTSDRIIHTSGLQDFNTSFNSWVINTPYTYQIGSVYSYNYNMNNTYQINYRIHLGGNNTALDWIKQTKGYLLWTYQIYGYLNATDGYQDNYIKSSSCSVRYDTSTNNGFLVSCNVSLNQNVSRINILIDFTRMVEGSVPGWRATNFTSERVNLISAEEYQGDQAIIQDQTNQIINSNNTNTSNIINNQNKNTEDIINNQNELMGNKCSNILDLNNYSLESYNNTYEKDINSLKIHANGTWSNVRFKNIEVEKNTTYYLKMKYAKDFDYYTLIGVYQNDSNNTIITEKYFANRNGTIDINFNTGNNEYIRIGFFGSSGDYSSPQNIFFNEIILSKENKPYCKTGTYESKLDTTNNSINNLSDKMLDDNIDQDLIDTNYSLQNNSFGPFSTFLNLPLTWVNNILASNQTCHAINLPLPYLNNKYLTLPCMNGFWNGLGALGDLIQAFWLCIVGVKIFNGLFLLVVDTTSSKDNVDELTKLQTWEL